MPKCGRSQSREARAVASDGLIHNLVKGRSVIHKGGGGGVQV